MTIYLINVAGKYCIYSQYLMTKFNTSTPTEAFRAFNENIDTFDPSGLFHLDIPSSELRFSSDNSYFGTIEYSVGYSK